MSIFMTLLLVGLLLLPATVTFAMNPLTPPLMLASAYDRSVDVSAYWVSEKLDGVRGYWTGERLLTRSGRDVHLPDGFTDGWPDVPLDGELWLGRNKFDVISGLVRSRKINDPLWHRVRFVAFDLPHSQTPFEQRTLQMKALVGAADSKTLSVVSHQVFDSSEQLQGYLSEVVAKGGEGLMLNADDGLYEPSRTRELLKLKPVYDDEAEVIAHVGGKGKYEGLMGAVLVKWQDRQFKIGSGFTLDQRRAPPAIGQQITFKFSGYTSTGLPRFARFFRVYEED